MNQLLDREGAGAFPRRRKLSGTESGPGASYAEDLLGPALPRAVQAFFTQERAWYRFVRGAGAVTAVE
jgi:hypothetical protein